MFAEKEGKEEVGSNLGGGGFPSWAQLSGRQGPAEGGGGCFVLWYVLLVVYSVSGYYVCVCVCVCVCSALERRKRKTASRIHPIPTWGSMSKV